MRFSEREAAWAVRAINLAVMGLAALYLAKADAKLDRVVEQMVETQRVIDRVGFRLDNIESRLLLHDERIRRMEFKVNGQPGYDAPAVTK